MKIRTILTVAGLLAAPVLLSACGDKNKDDGAGGATAADNRASIDSLLDEIAELEALLETAADEDIPALEEALSDAQDRLAELETCENGGDCTGVSTVVGEMSQLTDAYCDWVFNCCEDDEVRATIGAAAGDAAGCKDLYTNMLERGTVGASSYLPDAGLPLSIEDMLDLAEGVQNENYKLRSANITACAEQMAAGQCADAEGSVGADVCDEVPENPCLDLWKGTSPEGGNCERLLLNGAYVDDCGENLVCEWSYSAYNTGVCVRQAVDGDKCQGDNDCNDDDASLYCDESVGECKSKPTAGQACVFEDPTRTVTDELRVPCAGDSFCSAETSECVELCDGSPNGDACVSDSDCKTNSYCDAAAYPDKAYQGECTPKADAGALSPRDSIATACKFGGTYVDAGDYRCDGSTGFDCEDYQGLMCDSGSCVDDACLADCTYNAECESGEVCEGGACRPVVGNGEECSYDEQCPAASFCNGATCEAKFGDGDDCSEHDECRSGNCNTTYGCIPEGGLGTGEDCSHWYDCSSERCDAGECVAGTSLADEGDDCDYQASITLDECKKGLFCKPSDPSNPIGGECAPQIDTGAVCDSAMPSALKQCAGNVGCELNTGVGEHLCPAPYNVEGASESCVLTSVHDASSL